MKSLHLPYYGKLSKGYIEGFHIQPTADIQDLFIDSGICRNFADTKNIIGSAMTKQSDAAWAAGTNAGGYDATGPFAAGDDVYINIITVDATGAVDYCYSKTFNGAPANCTFQRRIFKARRDAGNSFQFIHETQYVSGKQIRVKLGDTVAPNVGRFLEDTRTNPGTAEVVITSEIIPASDTNVTRPFTIMAYVHFLLLDPTPSANTLGLCSLNNVIADLGTPANNNFCFHTQINAGVASRGQYNIYDHFFGSMRYILSASNIDTEVTVRSDYYDVYR